MHHPGPPRFAAVGESLDLAPRDPDPEATYRWTVVDRPADSTVELADDPVVEFSPDAPGVYGVELTGPDDTYYLTVRAFPSEYAVAHGSGESGYSGLSGGRSGPGQQRSGSARGSGSARPDYSEGEGRPRIQLSGERDGDEVVLRAETKRFGSDEPLDVEFVVDDRDADAAGGRDALSVAGQEARLAVPDDSVRVHAVALGADAYSVPDVVRVNADGSVDHLTEPPEWSTEMTLYEIYLREFTDAPDGEVFNALTERLEYLDDLGVNTIWLTPVLQNDHADHGYNIVDFFDVANDLGTRREFEAFVDAAHDHGIKVLFDLVLNHTARDHPYFQEAYRNPDSEYYDWYDWQESGEPETYFDWPYIANLNFSNLKVRRHLLDAVEEWAPIVDGFRCDMAWAVPKSFWMEVRDRVKDMDEEFLLLDETIPYVADFHGRLFDIHFDTTLYFNMRQVGHDNQPATAVLDALDQRKRVGFPDHAGFMLYLENHDERRYLEECGRPEVEAASAAEFTLPGVPMLYGGQEIGMTERRGAVRWEDADERLYDHYQSLMAVREEIPALGYHGDLDPVDFEADSRRVVAYAREAEDRYVVVLNFGAGTQTVGLPDETVDPVDQVTGESVAAEGGVDVENVVVLPAEGSGQ